MAWDLTVTAGALSAWMYALRWAVRTDRASRASASVLREAETIVRGASRVGSSS